jgi:hypothetical protein
MNTLQEQEFSTGCSHRRMHTCLCTKTDPPIEARHLALPTPLAAQRTCKHKMVDFLLRFSNGGGDGVGTNRHVLAQNNIQLS